MTTIYHIITQNDWQQAQAAGTYHAESLTTQGFIHFSRRDQILLVANAVYHGQRDLLLLVVDPARLSAELRYEAPDPTQPVPHDPADRFPHLYGPLNLDAVERVVAFPPQADGTFRLPGDLYPPTAG